MNINIKKIDFKKIIRHLKFRWNERREHAVLRDWKILLVVFVLLLIMVCVIDVFIYSRHKKSLEGSVDISLGGQEAGIDQDVLQNVLDEIGRRAKRFEENLITPPDIKDPS